MSRQLTRHLPTAAALLCGLLLFSAFPPLSQTDAAWFALAPLLLALRHCSPRAGFRLGWLAGFVFWLASLAWLWRLIANDGPPALVLLGHGALAAYCALYMGLFGLATAWLWRGGRLDAHPWRRLTASLLLEPLLWVGAEHLRGTLLSGFPWNGLGVSQYRNSALIQCASWGGVAAVSALLVAVNGGIAAMLERTWEDLVLRRRLGQAATPPRRVFRLRSVELMAAMILAVACWLWGFERVRGQARRAAAAPRWRLALIHPDAPSIFERDDAGQALLAKALLDHTALAAATAPDLCVWPETVLPGSLPYDPATQALASNAVALAGVPLLAGGMEIEPGPGWEWQAGARYYNSAFLLGASGLPVATYRKQHLVPFGEFIPLESLFPWLTRLSPVGNSCTAGRASTIMAIAPRGGEGARGAAPPLLLSPLICFEDIMPYLARRAVRAGATLLVNLTNDAWFDGSCEPEQHLAQAVFRCVENGVPMARCANSGVTCTIDAAGRIGRRIGSGNGSGQAGFICDEVAVASPAAPTLFRRHGHLLLALPGTLLLLTTLACAVGSRGKRR